MIIFSGMGFMVPGITIFMLIAFELSTVSCSGDGQYFKEHSWPLAIPLLVSGAILWFLGTRLNGKPTRTLIDKDSGEEVTLRERHSFFFIPMEYCGLIICAIGIAATFGFGR